MKLLAVANPANILGGGPVAHKVTKLADQLNLAFLVYRGLVSDELQRKEDPPINTQAAQKALVEAEDKIERYWISTFKPNIESGLKIHGLDDDTASIVSGKYTGRLAKTINEVSDRAFIEGYNAALNKNWEKAQAWKRIAEAYGLDPVQMRKWITYYPEDGYHPTAIPEKSQDMMDRFLNARAARISENESWTIKNMGKQLMWEQKVRAGTLPKGTKKIWHTAEDELVCDVCGPLNGTVVAIESEYEASTGNSFFVPPLHVNCRCEIELEEFEVVTKFDKYKRDKNGRFSRVESRGAKPATLTRPTSFTRSGKSQQVATARGQAVVMPLQRRKEEKKLPYVSEIVVPTAVVEQVKNTKISEETSQKALAKAKANKVKSKIAGKIKKPKDTEEDVKQKSAAKTQQKVEPEIEVSDEALTFSLHDLRRNGIDLQGEDLLDMDKLSGNNISPESDVGEAIKIERGEREGYIERTNVERKLSPEGRLDDGDGSTWSAENDALSDADTVVVFPQGVPIETDKQGNVAIKGQYRTFVRELRDGYAPELKSAGGDNIDLGGLESPDLQAGGGIDSNGNYSGQDLNIVYAVPYTD